MTRFHASSAVIMFMAPLSRATPSLISATEGKNLLDAMWLTRAASASAYEMSPSIFAHTLARGLVSFSCMYP